MLKHERENNIKVEQSMAGSTRCLHPGKQQSNLSDVEIADLEEALRITYHFSVQFAKLQAETQRLSIQGEGAHAMNSLGLTSEFRKGLSHKDGKKQH